MVSRNASRRVVRGSMEIFEDLPFTDRVTDMAFSMVSGVAACGRVGARGGSERAIRGAAVATMPAAPIWERKERRVTRLPGSLPGELLVTFMGLDLVVDGGAEKKRRGASACQVL
jgi:hypothetical protein